MTPARGPTTIGIVANPASGRDIRRLVAKASVFPTAEKANMVLRLLTSFGAVGVDRALVSTDVGGISSAVFRATRARRPGIDPPWPEVRFVDDDPISGTGADTTNAIGRMIAGGAGAIVCLGGDGTARLAADACGDVPLLALSTGTNNAYPEMREATIAGLAAALVATGAVDAGTALRRHTVLQVATSSRREIALVDVCVTATRHIGSRALWDPTELLALFCTFATPDAIGLSSIAGLLCPSPREEPAGVMLRFAPADRAPLVVRAPIAPGLVLPVGVASWQVLQPGAGVTIDQGGVIAVDGEREIELRPGESATITLLHRGPLAIDVPEVMAAAARTGLLRSPPDDDTTCSPPKGTHR